MDEEINLIPKDRIEWLDIAKGLGVLLVVVGHLWYNCLFPVVNQMIYSFHMPMFFILSGFVFKKGNSRFGTFVLKKAKRLLLPTFIFFVLGSIILIIADYPLTGIVKDFFFLRGLCPYNAPCWYFIALFQLSVISYFINLDKLSSISQAIVMFIAFAAGFFLYEFNISIPFGLTRTVAAFFFFACGAWLGKTNCKNKKLAMNIKISTNVGIMVLWIVFGVVLNNKVSFYKMILGNYFFFIIAGICGSILLIEFSKLLEKTKKIKCFFIKTSKNAIFIIGTHFILVDIIDKVANRFGLFNTPQYCLIVLCISLLVIVMYNFVSPFFKKNFPAITGDLR